LQNSNPRGKKLSSEEQALVELNRLRSTDYRISRGEPMQIQLTGTGGEFGGQPIEVEVDGNGEIVLDHLDPLKVEGMTSAEVKKLIRDQYKNKKIYRNPNANVTFPSKSIFVGGKVNQPAAYPYTQRITLTQAVNAAGGKEKFAHKDHISVTRDGITFKLSWQYIQKNPSQDPLILPGDSIFVGRTIL